MFEKFTRFFLYNEKITIVIITVISFFWIGAYIMLPKQYNPSIVAPAFNITIPVNWYTSNETSAFVAKELENKIMELQWVDKIMSYATENFSSTMVSFKVWESVEKAKTSLYDKIYWNLWQKPYWVSDIQIKSIDPEELPQLTLAITYRWTLKDDISRWIYLRNIALQIKESLKIITWTSVIDILWWYRNDISFKLDRSKIESFWLDFWSLLGWLSSNVYSKSFWWFDNWKTNAVLKMDNWFDDIKTLANTIISSWPNTNISMQDLWDIWHGPININSYHIFSEKDSSSEAVFLWISKQKWTNAVFVVEDVTKELDKIKSKLPKDIKISIIQNEWETAKKATNELLFHLFVSIFIVLFVLVIFLWLKNALNAAFCIPMVLWMVFIFALILGLDINRITLFALILSLWILVDDSIVVVENNARHLAMMNRTWKTKFEAVLDSVQEVGLSIVMSTVTRIMSFVAMFAVTGMMWDYMKPIPIFASIALLSSLFIAFSINPYLAAKFCVGWNCASHEEYKENSFLTRYAKLLSRYINNSLTSVRSRFKLKIFFWISLVLIIILPISLSIFKARMLPKADKNQVYVWIDAPRDYSVENTRAIESDLSNFLLNKDKRLPKDLDIVESVSSSVWDSFLWDFANLFRWWSNRKMANQISARINILENERRDIKSEDYVVRIRPLIRDFLLSKYPDVKFRLLEDPPGPPTMATFHIKAKWQWDISQLELIRFAEKVELMARKIEKEESLADLSDTISSSYKKVQVTLDNDLLVKRWLTANQIYSTLWAIYNEIIISSVHSKEYLIEPVRIVVWFDKKNISSKSFLWSLYFTNRSWEKVRLDEVSKIDEGYLWQDIYTDMRADTINIYSEIWSNSVVYPVLKMYDLLWTQEFQKMWYKKISSTPKSITFLWVQDGKEYRIEWGWEWEITMDTFRDLWIAMVLSLLVIYFLIVAQFKSFRVGWIVMMTFLLSFFGIFPWFSLLYLIKWEYFTATAMIWAIALWWIVVWNAIIMLDYIDQLIDEGKWFAYSVIEWSKKRFVPVMLTSVAAVFWSFIITSDPVWSWLAWSIIWWLSASAVLTLFFIPVLYFDYLVRFSSSRVHDAQMKHILQAWENLSSWKSSKKSNKN